MIRFFFGLFITLPVAAQAQITVASMIQEWQHRIGHDGSYFDAVMVPHGREFAFACGNHDARPSEAMAELGVTNAGPYSVNFSIPAASVPDGRPAIEGAVLTMGETGFALPPMARHPERPVYVVTLAMADPALAALRRVGSSRIALSIDGTPVFDLPILTSPAANFFSHCVTQFYVQGGGAPTELIGYTAPPFPRLQDRPTTYAPGAVSGLPIWLMEYLGAGCGAEIALRPRAIQFEDFDTDGAGDFVIDWNAMTCSAPEAAERCGPHGCDIEVFLSSRPGSEPTLRMRGTSVDIRTEGGFNASLILWGNEAACARNRCNDPIAWVEDRFQYLLDPEIPIPGATP